MGSICGNFLGAAFILLLPILMSHVASAVFAGAIDQGSLENYKKVVFGVLIIVFLVKEPLGLARMWHSLRERARAWPLRQW
jgi:branched-chain amino acid transport system permease protein